MSWARQLATGSGRVAFRLQMEGFPLEAVSARDMERITSDGRERVAGLDTVGLRLREEADIVTAEWRPQGFSVRLVDVNRRWTQIFTERGTETYLASVGSNSLSVSSVSGFPSSGVIYINTETIAYDTLGTSAFSTLTRGLWGSLVQDHYTLSGEGRRNPLVSDKPRVREGRRVNLYVYGSGDDPQGDGTKIWTGVVSTEPEFDGLAWSLRVDPITRKWDQDIGADLDQMGIRGIQYSDSCPLEISIEEDDGSAVRKGSLRLSGFWEDNQNFIEALNDEIGDLITQQSLTFGYKAQPAGNSWRIEFKTAAGSSTTKKMKMWVWSPYQENAAAQTNFRMDVFDEEGRPAESEDLSPSTVHYAYPPEAEEYPRGVLGRRALSSLFVPDVENLSGEFDYRIRLGGAAGLPDNISAVYLAWGDAEGTAPVISTDNTERYIDCSNISGAPPIYVASDPDVKLGYDFGSGGAGLLANALGDLFGRVPRDLNLGSIPDIRASDFASLFSTTLINDALTIPIANGRTYTMFSPTSFADWLKEECKLLSVVPAYDANARVGFVRVRLPNESEPVDATIGPSDIIAEASEGFLAYAPSPYGMFSTVQLNTGYNSGEDEHQGITHILRDVSAHGLNPDSRVLEISPYSQDRDTAYTRDEIIRSLSPITDIFGAPYAMVRLTVKFTCFPIRVGQVVSLTCSKIPNAQGTLGVTNIKAFVVSREWDFDTATGKLGLLLAGEGLGGYAPGARIGAITSGTSGTTGPFTVTLSSATFPSGTDATDFFPVGARIRLTRWNSEVSTFAVGDVTAVSGLSVTFTTDANWAHAAGQWSLGYTTASGISVASQKSYAYMADTDNRIDFSGDPNTLPRLFGS